MLLGLNAQWYNNLLCGLLTLGYSLFVQAAVPISEIQSVISARALHPPLPSKLSSLNEDNLDQVLKELDPYARYIPPVTQQLKKKAPPRYLGVEVFKHESTLWVRSTPNSPASQAGLPEISMLFAINHKQAQGNDLSQVLALIDKAVLNDDVLIEVIEKTGDAQASYSVKPHVRSAKAFSQQYVNGYLVIRIDEFLTRNIAPALSAIYRVLVDQQTEVILDLRGSVGGDLYEALEIAGMFVPVGQHLVNTYDRQGVVVRYKSMPGRKLKAPVGVLIDKHTASAAEVLAGILKFYRLSSVIGEQSYGKCLSTTVMPLANKGELWFTNLGIRFPDNSSCTDIGIKPDINISDISILKLTDILNRVFETNSAK